MIKVIPISIYTFILLIPFINSPTYGESLDNTIGVSNNTINAISSYSANEMDYIVSKQGLVLLKQSSTSGEDKTPYLLSLTQSQWENSRDFTDIFGLLKISTNPQLTNELLVVTGEMAYSPSESMDIEKGFRLYAPRMYNLNLNGKLMGVEYGALYRSFDSTYEKLLVRRDKKDRIGKELWIKKNFGVVTVKSFISDYLNDIYLDPSVPRTRKSQLGTALEIAIPNLPMINLSYSRGKSETMRKTNNSGVQTDSNQNYDAYIYYWKDKWDMSLSSSLTLSTNNEQSDLKSKISTIELSGTYRPDWTLEFTPTIGISNENYAWFGGGVDYLMKYASISISYFPSPSPFSIYLYGYYYIYNSSDTYTNTKSFNGYTELAWNLGKNFLGQQKLSLEFGCYNYIDNVYSISNYNEFTSMIAYKITGL